MTTETAEVKGRFETIRKYLYVFLIVIFLTTPWIKMNSAPLVMLDIWNRHFIILGHHFFSHDAPLLFFILISLVFIIALVTAVWGRIWCGWACPQTVFISAVYQKIENIILGSYAQRIKLKSEALNLKIIFKKSLLAISFLAFSYLISHSFFAYFIGADRIIQFIQDGPAKHFILFIFIQISTLLLTINFGWFRHRFCHLMCPYGRFQNVLLDNNSLSVIYMKHAGEPRKSKTILASEQGACIDCGRCVNVCPMKIDIRHGFQLECINCAACIDACDEIMTKIKKPTGLIQFSSADGAPINLKRFRVLLYAGIIVVALSFLSYQLAHYHSIELEINRSKQNAFMVENKESIKIVTNQFEGQIKNQKIDLLRLEIKLSQKSTEQGFKLVSQNTDIELKPFENKSIHLFVTREIQVGNTLNEAHEFEIEFKSHEDITTKKFKLLGGS